MSCCAKEERLTPYNIQEKKEERKYFVRPYMLGSGMDEYKGKLEDMMEKMIKGCNLRTKREYRLLNDPLSDKEGMIYDEKLAEKLKYGKEDDFPWEEKKYSGFDL